MLKDTLPLSPLQTIFNNLDDTTLCYLTLFNASKGINKKYLSNLHYNINLNYKIKMFFVKKGNFTNYTYYNKQGQSMSSRSAILSVKNTYL